MAEFSSPSALRDYVKNIKFAYNTKQRIVNVKLSDENITDRKQIYELRVEIEGFRKEMLTDISGALTSDGYKNKLDFDGRSYRSSAGEISVLTGVNKKGNPITTYIVVKLNYNALVLKEQLFNSLLLSLPNFRSIKYTPDSVYEVEILREFNSAVMKYGEGDPVTVKIYNTYYDNIIGMVSGPPGTKADIILIDRNGSYAGFISHKAGNSPTDFQQYGGISVRSGVFNDTEVRRFRNDVVTLGTKTITEPVYRRISDDSIKEKSVFGKDHTKSRGERSVDNVDFFAQGRIVINVLRKDNPTILKVGFTSKLVHKLELYKLPDNYDPVLGARAGEKGRKIEGDGDIILGVRGGVFPLDYIKTRRNSKEI